MTDTVRPRTLADLRALIGVEIGPTDWVEVTQRMIDLFAEATGDHQWIHTDPARAADGPFGTTIAHGLYSLSLSPDLAHQLMAFDGFRLSLNYGYEKIRFPAPVPVGSKLRLRLTVLAADPVGSDAVQIRISQIMEREGSDKPVFVAESLARVILADV